MHNAASCCFHMNDVQTFPELKGEAKYALSAPLWYAPKKPPVISDHDVKTLHLTAPRNIADLDALNKNMATHQYGAHFNALTHLHATSTQHERKTNLIVISLITVGCTATFLYMLFYPPLFTSTHSTMHHAFL